MNIVIIGANSAIGTACARKYAADKHRLFIAARDQTQIDILAKDLRVRGARDVSSLTFDALDFDSIKELANSIIVMCSKIDILIITHGTLPDQNAIQDDGNEIVKAFFVNQISTILLASKLSVVFEKQRCGTIVIIGSVAGDKGRQSNYIYGAAKSALETFTQGLRNRLSDYEVKVLLIKPGFVDTPMTAGFDKGMLWVKPEKVAKDITRAIANNSYVCYTPWFWRYIMFIVRNIPETLFIRMKL